jgi:hypothetical protein
MATTRRKPAPAAPADTAARVATATRAAAATRPATKKSAAKAPAAPVETAGAAGGAVDVLPAAPAAAAPAATLTRAATAKPASTVPTPPGIERRRSPREKLVAPAVLQPASGDASVDRGVQVQDLSLGGVGFVSPEKMDPGEVFRITLGKGPLLLNARVRIISCNKTGHRMYRCGAEFC